MHGWVPSKQSSITVTSKQAVIAPLFSQPTLSKYTRKFDVFMTLKISELPCLSCLPSFHGVLPSNRDGKGTMVGYWRCCLLCQTVSPLMNRSGFNHPRKIIGKPNISCKIPGKSSEIPVDQPDESFMDGGCGPRPPSHSASQSWTEFTRPM